MPLMRVCLITPTLDAFKGANHLPLLAAVPDTEFTILTNRVKPEQPDLPKNVKVETLHARLGSYYYGFADAFFARAVLHRYPADHAFWKQFDVIHLNQTMGPSLLHLQETGVPVLFFVHHPVSADLHVATQESSTLVAWNWRLKYALLKHWQKRFCRKLPHTATVSKTSAERIAKDYKVDTSRIHVVPNGIDGNVFTNEQAPQEFDVLAIGSFIHPRKGFCYLAETYRQLAAKGLRIADVGRRSSEQRKELRAIPEVQVFGNVDEDTLLSVLHHSKALVSTSLYEGFGLSLIEALACGRPAFAFNGGAVGEVLTPIDPQLVVPLRDINQLVRRIVDFVALPQVTRTERGEQYRKAVLELYPLQKSAIELKKLYEKIQKT